MIPNFHQRSDIMSWSFVHGKNFRPNKSNRQRRNSQSSGGRKARFEQLEHRDLLATFTVTNLLDAAVAPAGSLRAAIEAANDPANPGADVIQFAPGVMGTINLAAGAGELGITESVSITGPGLSNLTIDATASVSRIFRIDAGDVSMRGLTLTNGDAGVGNGGAIGSTSLGTLSIADAIITGSNAVDGGAIFVSGDLILTNVTIGGTGAGQDNVATSDGGGIFSSLGNVLLKNSTIVNNNAAGGDGGGINAFFGTVNLQNSTIDDNSASFGASGGIAATIVMAQNSTISNNSALGGGGGIDAITVMAKNSTVFGNSAGFGNGGGIRATNLVLQNSTVANNQAAVGSNGGVLASTMLNVQNSIIANNTALTFPDVSTATTTVVRFSLIGESDTIPSVGQFTITGPGAQNANGNFIGNAAAVMAISAVDAFGAGGPTLAANGGTTVTVALNAGSIAINKGNNSFAPAAASGDQRGLPFTRISPFGGTVDMGAFEVQTPTVGNNAPVVANAIVDQSTIVGNFFSFTFPANTFTDADGDVLTYSATLDGGAALPGWLTFDPVSRTFSGTPGPGDTGVYNIRVTATDGKGGSAADVFALTVTSNPPPVVANAIPDQNAAVGVPYTFTFAVNTFTDPNGDPLTYSATKSDGTPLPAWLSFNAGTRTFTGTPAAGDIGATTIRVTANDGQGNTVSDDFVLTVSNSELPFNENFEGAVDPRIMQKSPSFATTATNPINGSVSFQATRNTVGDRPLATVDFVNPATAGNVTNVSVNVSTLAGNGSSLWSNALVTFDYQSTTNYKFAGVFEIIDKLIIGQVVNGRVSYLAIKQFPAAPNTSIPLNVAINRVTRQVTLTSGATVVQHTFATLGTGTVGVGTINANAKFDSLVIT
jgi:hypothetical protein